MSAQNTRVLLVCLPLALIHCAAAENELTQPQSGEGQDSGVPGKRYSSSLGEGTTNCTFGDEDEISLLSIFPEYVTLFSHLDSPCDSLSSRVLIRNSKATPVVVNGVSVEPASFDIENGVGEFPRQIPASGSLALSIRHSAGVAGATDGRLVLSTDGGCTQFSLLGLGTTDSLMTVSDLAIDFGAVRRGEVSEPRSVSVLLQGGESTVSLEGFGTLPTDFRFRSRPEEPASALCDPISFVLEFAPGEASALGVREGSLSWLTLIKTSAGEDAEGIVLIPLLGTATQ